MISERREGLRLKHTFKVEKGVQHMYNFDETVLDCFLENQTKLFPQEVAATREEADDFLSEVMAVVVDSPREVWEYFDEECIDTDGADEDEILEADEVFELPDGRYLIVES